MNNSYVKDIDKLLKDVGIVVKNNKYCYNKYAKEIDFDHTPMI